MARCNVCGIETTRLHDSRQCVQCFLTDSAKVIAWSSAQLAKGATPGGKSLKFETTTRIRIPRPPPPKTIWERLTGPDII